MGVRLAQHAHDLDLEAVVLRRLRCCVDLEILRDRINVRPERLDKGAVRRLRREHDPGSSINRKADKLGTCATSRHAGQGREKS
jgi:hypothetical protein